MSKKTVFSNPTGKASLPRNGFDRSFPINVNFSAGMLVPTFCQFVFGKSHVRLNQRSFMRSQQVIKPAFPSLPMYTDYFYVPMHQIMTNWNAFRTRVNDRSSSLIGVPSRVPAFSHTTLRTLFTTSLQQSYVDESGAPSILGYVRLLDLLGYGLNTVKMSLDVDLSDSHNLDALGDMTPLKLCAYQKIYYDHYRNTAYEANEVSAYNIDNLFGSVNQTTGQCAPASIDAIRLSQFLKLHFVNYRRDVFQTIYPSLNFVESAANGAQTLNTIPSSVVDLTNNLPKNVNGLITPSGFTTVLAYPNGNVNTNQTFNLGNLRAAFALEKLLRLSAFAPQHVVDQFEARFGYRPRSASLHESVRLGSFKNDILIGEVTSQADTTGAALGEVGGKGVGASDYDRTISYDVPEDGFIMALSYVLPHPTYDSNFIDPINQQFVPEDWSLPEYASLGLQPIMWKNVFIKRRASDTDSTQQANMNTILGYQPRDMQYKASVAVNHGLFNDRGDLSAFVLHGRKDYFSTYCNTGVAGLYSNYFKCMPSDLNSIFAENYDGSEAKDHFFGHIVHSFACIQDKPIFGIPNL